MNSLYSETFASRFSIVLKYLFIKPGFIFLVYIPPKDKLTTFILVPE